MEPEERESFQSLFLSFVKPWTRERRIVGSTVGVLPAVGWLVLALQFWASIHNKRGGWDLCVQFLEYVISIDWETTTVDLLKPSIGTVEERPVMTILSPSIIRSNAAKMISQLRLDRIRHELLRAASLSSSDQALDERALIKEGGVALVIAIGVKRRCDASAADGWLHGRVLEAMETLQRESAVFSDPWPCIVESTAGDLEGIEAMGRGCKMLTDSKTKPKYLNLCAVLSFYPIEENMNVKLQRIRKVAYGLSDMFQSDMGLMIPAVRDASFSCFLVKERLVLEQWYRPRCDGRFL